jgi:hypothetical protein
MKDIECKILISRKDSTKYGYVAAGLLLSGHDTPQVFSANTTISDLLLKLRQIDDHTHLAEDFKLVSVKITPLGED